MRLTLSNFQIHRDKTVEIPENETTYLEGDSDTGKSSCIRSLFWALFNKPDGSFFVTIGSPRGTTSKVGFAFGEHTVTRERGKTAGSRNVYALDGQTYEAFGRDVPEPVAKALNISPYAIQIRDPREPLFLVSHTPTEAAKILADACGLGAIDTATAFVRGKKAAAEAEIRKTEILLESAQRRLADTEAQLPLAGALDKAGALAAWCENAEEHAHWLKAALADEPQGGYLDVEAARAAAERGRSAASEAVSLRAIAGRMLTAIRNEPQGATYDLEDVRLAVAGIGKSEAARADLIRMRDALCRLIGTEPKGDPIDTTELKQQRAAIPVCPTCGREL